MNIKTPDITGGITPSAITADSKRVKFIDIAKGIGIILVVWYHIGHSPAYALNLFFMPLFIFMSGMFFNPSRDAKSFFSKKSRGLLMPLLLGVILGIPVEIFINNLWNYYDSLNSGYYTFGLLGNVPLWFLLCLFYVSAITYAVENCIKRKALRIAIYAVLSAVGAILSILELKNCLYLGHALLVLPFFLIGYRWRDYWLSRKWFSPWLVAICIIVFLAISYLRIPLTNIHQLVMGKTYVTSFIAAMAATFAVLGVSVLLSRYKLGKWLATVGEGTIVILILHDLFVHSLQHFIETYLPDSRIITTPIVILIAVALSILCLYIGKYLKRLLPRFF